MPSAQAISGRSYLVASSPEWLMNAVGMVDVEFKFTAHQS